MGKNSSELESINKLNEVIRLGAGHTHKFLNHPYTATVEDIERAHRTLANLQVDLDELVNNVGHEYLHRIINK